MHTCAAAELFFPVLPGSNLPVSYTHLDVYKRQDILSSGSSETIRTNLPANCRLLVQIFSHLYPKYEKLPPVIQILPLHQNPSASPDYNMNLETFLCTLLPILSGFVGYQPYYY